MPNLVYPLPTPEEIIIAKEGGRKLSTFLQTDANNQKINILDNKGHSHSVQLPLTALRLLVNILTEIGEGNAVNVTPLHAELTTQEAADVLNVSRPFLVKILEQGDIPFHKVGAHRRVRYQDIIHYKNQIDNQRKITLDELSAQAQEYDMGY